MSRKLLSTGDRADEGCRQEFESTQSLVPESPPLSKQVRHRGPPSVFRPCPPGGPEELKAEREGQVYHLVTSASRKTDGT